MQRSISSSVYIDSILLGLDQSSHHNDRDLKIAAKVQQKPPCFSFIRCDKLLFQAIVKEVLQFNEESVKIYVRSVEGTKFPLITMCGVFK